MAAAGETVPAKSAGDMPFSAHYLAGMKARDIGSGFDHLAHELVADDERNRNCALRPLVPFVDVYVGSTDARAQHANQNIVDPDRRPRNIFQPQTGLAAAFDEGLHAVGFGTGPRL